MSVKLPIGVFDSGMGGLTVFIQLRKLLPAEDILYFGDTKRTPYGIRTSKEIQNFTREILDFMIRNHVKLAVAACNTITVNLNNLPQEYPFPIIGMSTGSHTALKLTKNNRIGIIGTDATIRSGKHAEEIRALSNAVKVYPKACHKFASLVEQEKFSGKDINDAAREYLLPLKKTGVDTVILACTHYPLIISVIRNVLGPNVNILDPAEETACNVKKVLGQKGLLANGQNGSNRLCFSADIDRAKRIAARLFDIQQCGFEYVDLSQ